MVTPFELQQLYFHKLFSPFSIESATIKQQVRSYNYFTAPGNPSTSQTHATFYSVPIAYRQIEIDTFSRLFARAHAIYDFVKCRLRVLSVLDGGRNIGVSTSIRVRVWMLRHGINVRTRLGRFQTQLHQDCSFEVFQPDQAALARCKARRPL